MRASKAWGEMGRSSVVGGGYEVAGHLWDGVASKS